MNWLDDNWRNGLSPRQKEYILALAQAERQIYWRRYYRWLGLRVRLEQWKGEVYEEDGRQFVITGQTTGTYIDLWAPYWWWRVLRVKWRDRHDRRADREAKKHKVPPMRLLP